MESALVAGHGGIFEVRLDDRVVYTNDRRGGIPTDVDVLAALRRALG